MNSGLTEGEKAMRKSSAQAAQLAKMLTVPVWVNAACKRVSVRTCISTT